MFTIDFNFSTVHVGNLYWATEYDIIMIHLVCGLLSQQLCLMWIYPMREYIATGKQTTDHLINQYTLEEPRVGIHIAPLVSYMGQQFNLSLLMQHSYYDSCKVSCDIIKFLQQGR